MGFYKSIAEVYNKIFPLNPGQVAFTNNAFPIPGKKNLLDIGCGTGSLTLALSDTFNKVVGIDLDEAMLEKAEILAGENTKVSFSRLDMLDIQTRFENESFDGIVCFGNTLVHLSSMEQIVLFFESCVRLLRPEGKLLIQIINYDRILDQKIKALPTIENDDIQFIRNYLYHTDKHQIDFETLLTNKTGGQVIRNKVPLFPVRKSEIEAALLEAGFSKLKFFGNFKGEPLRPDSIPLICEAS